LNPALPWAREISGIRFDADDEGFGQEALAKLLDNVPVALAVSIGPEQRYVFANRLVREALRKRAPELIGHTVPEVMRETFSPEIQAKRQRVLETGEPQEILGHPIPAVPGGEPSYWDLRLAPVYDAAGTAVGILTIGVDVTAERQARAEAENQARETEYHAERLKLAIDATELGLWEWDAVTGQVFWSERQRAIFGLPEGEPATYARWRDAIHAEDRERVLAAVGALMDPASGGQLHLEHRVVHPNGDVRWVLGRGRMLYEIEDGELKARRLLGTVLDITDRKRAEEERQLLVRELNHRVKNLFAVASGMVSLTARSAATPQEMGKALRGRLEALSRAHSLIQPVIAGAEVKDRQALVGELAEAVLAPYAGADRLTLGGDAVAVGRNAATSLTLVLHELATNAAKYGALSADEGRLFLLWSMDDERVAFEWREEGGPPVPAPPETEGFGSQLARKSITGQLGGTVEHDWRREGLVVRIVLPVDRLSR
jgi:PAS domain S-box-containing protein